MEKGQLDDRLLKRREVEMAFGALREGKIAPQEFGQTVQETYQKTGIVMLKILLRHLEAPDLQSRYLAASCLTFLPATGEVKQALFKVARDRKASPWVRGTILIALKSLGEDLDELFWLYPDLEKSLFNALTQEYIDVFERKYLSPYVKKSFSFEAAFNLASTAMKCWQFEEAVRLLKVILEALPSSSPLIFPAGLQLVMALLRSGEPEEALAVAERITYAGRGSENFYTQKISYWMQIIRCVLNPEAEEQRTFELPFDLVETGVEILCRNLKREKKFSEQAVVLWNAYLRYTTDPPLKIDAPLAWATAIIYVLGQLRKEKMPKKEIKYLAVVVEVKWKEVLTFAEKIWQALDLGNDPSWFQAELALLGSLDEEEEEEEEERIPTEVEEIVSEFLESVTRRYSLRTAKKYVESLSIFTHYLTSWAGVESFREVRGEELTEFLAWWYIRRYLASSPTKAKNLLSSLKHFFTWLERVYGISLLSEYLKIYAQLRDDLPRVISLPSVLGGKKELKEKSFRHYLDGWFRVLELNSLNCKLKSIHSEYVIRNVVLPPEAKSKLKCGDIVNLELGKSGNEWYIIACAFACPPLAKSFLR